MAAVVRNMAAANGADDVKVLTGVRDAEQLRQLLCGTLRSSFRNTPEVFPNRNIHAGMQVAFQGEDMYVDLTDEAVCELLRAHLGCELARILEAK
jgi:vacuolar-type H+-ATPase subunit E/Vma4